MSMPIWMSIEPRGMETRLMLSLPGERPVLRAYSTKCDRLILPVVNTGSLS
jgi:hypothetical protein